MGDSDNDVEMAQCGACGSIIPIDSSDCTTCGVRFSGVSEEEVGECSACGAIVPLSSKSCSKCGVSFVMDDVLESLRRWLKNTGFSIMDLFGRFDENDDGRITTDEMRKGLLALNIAALPPAQVDKLIEEIDKDDSGDIDLNELDISLLGKTEKAASKVDTESDDEEEESDDEEEESDDEEEESDDEDDEEESDDEDDEEESDDEDEVVESAPKGPGFMSRQMSKIYPEEEDFPTDLQSKLSSKKWVDNIFWLLHMFGGILAILPVVNAMIGLPITGSDGQKNSKSILIFEYLFGEKGSDTTELGWNIDGIIILIIGITALCISIWLHMLAKGWRAKIIAKRKDAGDDEDAEQDDSDDDDDDDDNDDDDDEEIDVGSRVGVEDELEDTYYGVIVSFNDDDDTVVIEREDDDEKVTVPFDTIFVE